MYLSVEPPSPRLTGVDEGARANDWCDVWKTIG